MGLTLPSAPNGSDQVVATAIHRAMAAGRLSPLATLGGSGPRPAAPHEVFNLGLDAISSGESLTEARRAGWRTIVLNGTEPIALVDFSAQGSSGETYGGTADPQTASMNYGPFARATVEAMLVAEKQPQVLTKDYLLRVLEVPALYVLALWLHREQENLYVPLSPAPDELDTRRLYDERELMEILRPMARRRLEQNDEPSGGLLRR